MPGEGFVPEVLFEGKYYPVCGHYFWDNDYGAETICKALGFDGGAKARTSAQYEEHAMPVGKCNSGEALDKCTAGGNAFGNLDDRNGWCNAGTDIGVEVVCQGHTHNHITYIHIYIHTLHAYMTYMTYIFIYIYIAFRSLFFRLTH